MSRSHAFNDVLYFIDASVPDVGSILNEIPTPAEVRIVTSAEDGISQILSALAGKRDVSAIHLVSHGQPGGIVLGDSVVDVAALAARADDVMAIGRALAFDADLLIYGCNVAEGESGKAFLDKLSDLTGANVAASETLTGAAELGGDWNLEIRLGNVQAPVLHVPAYAGVLAAPTISGLTPISYTENGPAQLIQGVSFSGGSGYADGSITFGVTGSNSSDQLVLSSDTNPTAAGAISVDGSNVYLGNGTGRELIGTVDSTNNGKDGRPLTIKLIGNSTGVLSNSSFEGSTNGWTIRDERVILGTTVINGQVTPTDLTAPANSTNGAGGGIDNGGIGSGMTYRHELATDQHTDGNNSLRLVLSGQTADGYDVVHGPYAYSDTFVAQAGDIFKFDWRAAAGGDAFDAFGYLMNADTGEYVRVLDATGANSSGETNWATQSVTVPKTGNWYFVFVGGTYDFSGGRAVGGSLYIDNFKVLRSPVNDTVLTNLAKQVQYTNTSESPPDAPRPLTIDVADGSGNHQTGSTTVDITPVNDLPAGAVTVAGTPTQGQELTATNNVTDPDGIDLSTVAYQWQRQLPDGTWQNITGATGDKYTLTQDDVNANVRAVLSYTDLGGTPEQVPGNALPVGNVNDLPTGTLTIIGEAQTGRVLTAVNTVADVDGLGPFTYQWMADGEVIQGASGSTLTLDHEQLGKTITVKISYIDQNGTPESVSSPATPTVRNDYNDHYVGGPGNDRLFGGASDDRLDGGQGRDKFYGEAGNDILNGGAGHDTLDGGAGNDAVKGGSGNDWIVGGLGRDKLWGGAGRDVFDFNSIQESRAGSQRDVIYDFRSGQDKVDLRGIDANELRKGNQAFTWACMDGPFMDSSESISAYLDAAFTGKAGQLRYDRGILSVDTDGDRKADFQIKIIGSFSHGDVIL